MFAIDNVSVDESEHPDGDGVPGGKFQIVFYKISDFGLFNLLPLLASSPTSKVMPSISKSDNLEEVTL